MKSKQSTSEITLFVIGAVFIVVTLFFAGALDASDRLSKYKMTCTKVHDGGFNSGGTYIYRCENNADEVCFSTGTQTGGVSCFLKPKDAQ